MNVLLAEDDVNLGNLLSLLLKKQGVKVNWAQDGESAYQATYNDVYDVLILDWMMPKLSGLELCRRLREENYQGKILMLTAKDTVDDLVEGLNNGADDYLVKPFDIKELVARLNALSRRHSSYVGEKIEYRGYVLDTNSYTLEYKGKSVEIRAREFKVLELLLRNHGQILPRELIIERIWGLESDITENNLDVHIRMLRKKISTLTEDELIATVRGVGYYVK